MVKQIRYKCEECDIKVGMGVEAPPRDIVAVMQKFQNFFYKCPRCDQEMQEEVYKPNFGWAKEKAK